MDAHPLDAPEGALVDSHETVDAHPLDAPDVEVLDADETTSDYPEHISDPHIVDAEVLELDAQGDVLAPDDILAPEETLDDTKQTRRQKLMAAIPSVASVSLPKVKVPTAAMAKVSVQNFEAGAQSWIAKLPEAVQPFARLARIDKPIGFLLLALPCWIGLAFARIQEPGVNIWDPYWLLILTIGAVLMRSAGCVWNDIADRKVDAEVERTKDRPLPSGDVTLNQAIGFLGVLLFFAFVVWLVLPVMAKFVAAAAIPLVAAYPFMKKITWWPQAWLGLTFSWGVLVAAAIGGFSAGTMALYFALACWTIAYDTIYAMQDAEDDALIGVRSTARLFGEAAPLGALAFHGIAALLIALAAHLQGATNIGVILMVLFGAHGLWQAWRVDQSAGAEALEAFKSNAQIGFVVFLGFVVAALWETIWGGLTRLF